MHSAKPPLTSNPFVPVEARVRNPRLGWSREGPAGPSRRDIFQTLREPKRRLVRVPKKDVDGQRAARKRHKLQSASSRLELEDMGEKDTDDSPSYRNGY